MLDVDFVLKATGGKLLEGQKGSLFAGVSVDSRRIKNGELFFAIKGARRDGHDFVNDAIVHSATGAVVERELRCDHPLKALIMVQSTVRALGDLALAKRNIAPDLTLAAITGSNGKTTTKEMAVAIVSIKYDVHKNEGNLNNEIGLPLTLLKLEPHHRSAVVELGMNNFGEIRRLSEIANPDVGAITNIGRGHLEKLGDLKGVARAKAELVEGFTSRNTFVANTDDPWVEKISRKLRCPIITTGVRRDGVDIRGLNIEQGDFTSIKFTMDVMGKEFPVRLKGIGLHNVSNALTAAGVAVALGCDAREIQAGLERFEPAQMRLEVIESPQGFKIINDTYNANPESMRSGVNELVRLKNSGRTIAVLGDMLELGASSEQEHLSLGDFVSGAGVDFVVTIGEFANKILEGTRSRVDGIPAQDHDEAASIVRSYAKPGDCVLIKGSRGMNMERIIKSLFEER
ncbi:MAG: UDP-N-acetylmuramoyl-tripeptide--D-alanyl-D-alanine ligase [Candidatus Dadabacteria bacterium]|nr:UDP-N-acetylmuramoyl-tripeptide--D-alanyl-D-alanine ligase [Candidatus Dadabacteria bacterium]